MRAAERYNLISIATPAASPQSNGIAGAFVNTLRRDCTLGADLSSLRSSSTNELSASLITTASRRTRHLVCGRWVGATLGAATERGVEASYPRTNRPRR